MSQRTDRVDELLQQEIGEILAREVADPRIGFATVTDVETTPDLRHARVWVSVIGPEAERRSTAAALQGAMGFVQRELGHRLRLKRIPALHVELDDTAQRGTRVLHLLEEIEAGRMPEEDAAEGETLPTPVPRIGRAGDAETEATDAPGDAEASGPGDPPAARRRSPARGRSPERGRGAGTGRDAKGPGAPDRRRGRRHDSKHDRGSGHGKGADRGH
jgi:ribosome-binding factor A